MGTLFQFTLARFQAAQLGQSQRQAVDQVLARGEPGLLFGFLLVAAKHDSHKVAQAALRPLRWLFIQIPNVLRFKLSKYGNQR